MEPSGSHSQVRWCSPRCADALPASPRVFLRWTCRLSWTTTSPTAHRPPDSCLGCAQSCTVWSGVKSPLIFKVLRQASCRSSGLLPLPLPATSQADGWSCVCFCVCLPSLSLRPSSLDLVTTSLLTVPVPSQALGFYLSASLRLKTGFTFFLLSWTLSKILHMKQSLKTASSV